MTAAAESSVRAATKWNMMRNQRVFKKLILVSGLVLSFSLFLVSTFSSLSGLPTNSIHARLFEEFVPSFGDWLGPTSEGYSVSFTVNMTGTHVTPFEIRYDEVCGSKVRPAIFHSVTIGNHPGTPIIDNRFVIDGFGKVFTGTFTSAVSGIGVYDVSYYDYTLQTICTASGTWTMMSEASAIKTFLPILVNDTNP